MKFKNLNIPNGITNRLGRQVLQVRKHSPAVMFGAGIVGVVTSTVLACRATLKLDEVLEKTQADMGTAKELFATDNESYTAKDYTEDMAKLRIRTAVKVGKLYAPSLAVGVVSIGLLTGSHIVLNKRNLALTAAYGAVEKGFREYRDRVRQELGDEKEREFRYGFEEVEEVVEGKNGSKVTKTKRVNPVTGKSIYAKFFDEYSKNWNKEPEYNRVFLQCQQNYANDLLKARGHVFLNEVYDMLGLDRTSAGAVVGWVFDKDGDNFIDFGLFDGEKLEIRNFINGHERSILLDFNVDGTIYDKI